VWIAERDSTPVGYAVTRVRDAAGRRLGYVAELDAIGSDRPVLADLLAHAVTHLRDRGAELVAALAVPGTALDRSLVRAGFLFSWGAFNVHAVSLARAGPLAFHELQAGDFDVV
jgi:hypothetical protein